MNVLVSMNSSSILCRNGLMLTRSLTRTCVRTLASSNSADKKMNSTVDEKEVNHHKQFASDWWNPYGSMKGLHSMNNLRVPLICNGLLGAGKYQDSDTQEFLKGFHILDVGCGGGILSIPLSRLGGNVTGIDPGCDVIRVAEEQVQKEKLTNPPTFICTTIEDHAANNQNKYDAVILSEVIEHVTKKQEFLITCASVLKPGGSIFVTTINRTMASWLLAIIAAEYVLRLLPIGTHEWDKFVSPSEVQAMLEHACCRTKLIHGMTYIPFQNKWYWIPDKSVNYALHAVRDQS